MLYAQKHGVFRAYNDLAFDRFWRREFDPEDVDAVDALLAEAGAPPGFAPFLAGGAVPGTITCATKPRPRAFLACRPSFSKASCSGVATGSACCASGWTKRE
jgi:hypothetical protein